MFSDWDDRCRTNKSCPSPARHQSDGTFRVGSYKHRPRSSGLRPPQRSAGRQRLFGRFRERSKTQALSSFLKTRLGDLVSALGSRVQKRGKEEVSNLNRRGAQRRSSSRSVTRGSCIRLHSVGMEIKCAIRLSFWAYLERIFPVRSFR